MWHRWIIPILVLPGTVLVVIPAAIVWLTWTTSAAAVVVQPGSVLFIAGVVVAIPGLLLGGSTMAMFFRFGDGHPCGRRDLGAARAGAHGQHHFRLRAEEGEEGAVE